MVSCIIQRFLVCLPLIALAGCGGEGGGSAGGDDNSNGNGGSNGSLSAFSPKQFLIGNDGDSGNQSDGSQLWVTDGTGANTQKVKDIYPGDDADMREFTRVGNLLFFIADDGSGNDHQLWVSDGTEPGTQRLTDNSTHEFARMLTNVNGLLHFYAVDATSSLPALWTSDGTEAGTEQVISTNLSSDGIDLLTEFNDELFFAYRDSAGTGTELWRSDPGGDTALFANIEPDPSLGSLYTCPDRMVEMDGYLYFSANDGSDECDLWRTNGQIVSGEGQVEKVFDVADSLNTGPVKPVVTDNTLYFLTPSAPGTPDTESAIWISDGTETGTEPVFESNDDFQVLTDDLLGAAGYAYFYVRDLNSHNSSALQLWYTDGSEANLLVDLNDSVLADYEIPMAVVGDRLFYIALRPDTSEDTISPNHGLWTALGSQKTLLPTGIRTTGTSGIPLIPVADDNTLMFRSPGELWRTDGTSDGTAFVTEICPGPCDGLLGPIRAID